MRTRLLVLFAAVGLVVLIACANVANLMLGRAAARRKEIAVRAALGATRIRLMGQLLTESVLLSLMAAALAEALAYYGLAALKHILPANTPRLFETGIDARVLAFTLALGLITGIAAGLLPALRLSKMSLEQTLRASGGSVGASRTRRAVSSAVVVAEAGLVVVLVIGAGLLIRSLWALAQADTGMKAERVTAADITPASSFCRKADVCRPFYAELLARARGLSGVESAALAQSLPLTSTGATVIAVQDRPEYSAEHPYQLWGFMVSPGYFSTMGIPLLRGRDFSDQDRVDAPGVVIVSRTIAENLWPGEDPIGKQVKPSWMREWRTVVGVVGNVREYSVSPGAWADITVGDIYYPVAQGMVTPPTELTLVVRSAAATDVIAREVRNLVASINAQVPVSNVRTMKHVIAESLAAPRSTASIFGGFAGLALMLGILGLYSVVAYATAERTREIAIRLAVGATRANVLRMVIAHGLRLVAIGTLLGVIGSVAATRLMRSLLYGVAASDPVTYAAVVALMILVASVACYVPARRAMKIEPMAALRYE